MFLLVPAYPGCPGSKAVKRSLLLLLIAETEEELIKRLNEWKDNVESKGMRVNMNKTRVMISGERQMVRQKDGHAGSAVKVSVAIQ